MADISSLTGLQAGDPLDWEGYPESKEGVPLPPKGRYTVRAKERFDAGDFGVSAKGSLSASVDPTIVGPTAAGHQLKYTRVYATPFKRQGKTVSQMGDYLVACGVTGVANNPQAMADAIERTAGAIYQIDGDWEAYCKDCKFELKGEENFPSDGNGGHIPWTRCPNCSKGEELKNIRANFKVDRYVSAGA